MNNQDDNRARSRSASRFGDVRDSVRGSARSGRDADGQADERRSASRFGDVRDSVRGSTRPSRDVDGQADERRAASRFGDVRDSVRGSTSRRNSGKPKAEHGSRSGSVRSRRESASGGRRGHTGRSTTGRRRGLGTWLDRLRKDDVSTVIVNSAIVAVALVIALGVLALLRPQITLSRARRLADAGQADKAEAMLNLMTREGYAEADIADVRGRLAESCLSAGEYDRALSLVG